MRGYAVIMHKGYRGKSRLELSQEARTQLQNALIQDIHAEMVSSGRFDRILIATPDSKAAGFCENLGMEPYVLSDPDNINPSLTQVTDFGVREGYDMLFVAASDLPLFSSALIDGIVDTLDDMLQGRDAGAVFCPSKGMGMTVCCAAPPDSVELKIDHKTPNLLLIDDVAGDTPRNLFLALEAFLDLDGGDDLREAFTIMNEMPAYHHRRVYAQLKKLLGD